MSKKISMLMCALVVSGLLFFGGCSTSENGGNYTLTVAVSAGVTGTPATGSYTYAENDAVTYSYSLQPGYVNLTVTLDGMPTAASGVITITGSHVLNVTADQIDIRDAWAGYWDYMGYQSFMRVEFSGSTDGGTCGGYFDAFPYGGSGTWTLVGTQIDFMLEFPAPYQDFDLVCTATLSGQNQMVGTWIWQGIGLSGSFQLDRL
jgi:hypothetical protein